MRKEPYQITAGDLIEWTRHEDNYLPQDGWSLKYVLVSQANKYEFISVAMSDSHKISIPSATSQTFAAGIYYFQVKATDGTSIITIESGQKIEILPDFSTGPLDARTNAEVTLDAIDATLAGKATKDQQSLTVEGRTISRMSFEDLIAARKHFQDQVVRERQAKKIAKGLGRDKILVRFR